MKVDVDKIRGWFISKSVLVYDGATPVGIRPDKVDLILGPNIEYICKRSRPDLSRTYIRIDHVDRNVFSDCEEVATVEVKFKTGHRHTFAYTHKFKLDDVGQRDVARNKAYKAFDELRDAVDAYRNRSLWFKIARYIAFAVVVAVATVGTGLIIIIKGKK